MVVMDGGVACPPQPSPSAVAPLPPPPVTTSSSASWYDHHPSSGHQQQQLHEQQHQHQQAQGHHHHHGDGGGSAELAAADAYFKGQQSYFSQMQQYQGMSHGACKNTAIPHFPMSSARNRGRRLRTLFQSFLIFFHFQRNRK